MDDALLSYYNRELHAVRKRGAEFAARYPKIAGRLAGDKDLVEDPHVSRLIESFAFLTARIRHSLDDNFPDATEALMGILHPDYHAPLPSMSITQFRAMPNLSQKAVIPKGQQLEVKTLGGDLCYYQTCHTLSVLPIAVSNAQCYGLPFNAPSLPVAIQRTRSVQSILKLSIAPLDKEVDLACIDDDSLRFYINAQADIAFKLREYLDRHIVGIAIAEHGLDKAPLFLSGDAVCGGGFSAEEAAIEFDGRASSAHRLLVEYFLLPQKFLFAELRGLGHCWKQHNQGFDIYIYFDQVDADLLRAIDKDTFALGCVPVINLFESTIEPIQAADLVDETRLSIVDPNVRLADIYQVKDVFAIDAKGDKKSIKPFYGSHLNQDNEPLYWSLRRENSSWQGGLVSYGTDSYLNFFDGDYQLIAPESSAVINARVMCTNRDLPNKLPFGPGQPQVQLVKGGKGLSIQYLTPATPTVQPKLNEATRWQLIAQLSLQHFANKDGLLVLKEILRLYNFHDAKEVTSLIDGVSQLDTEVITKKVLNQGRGAMCQGTHFILTCDEGFYTGNSLHLFGCIIDEFISQFATINSFTQLSIKTTKNLRVELEWPARVACQTLV